MGMLRVLLAMTVCVNHYDATPGLSLPFVPGPGARLSVEIFFIISGFYMSLILTDKYVGAGGVKLFYLNRAVRLYPVYLLILGLYFALVLVLKLKTGNWTFLTPVVQLGSLVDPLVKAWLFISNLTFFGQDALFLFSVNPDTGALCLDCQPSLPGWLGLVIPQAWSVEVEMLFYLFAPLFVAWNTRVLATVVAVMIAVKMYLYAVPGVSEYWQFRFPPSALGLFLLGMLSHRLYRRFKTAPFLRGTTAKAACALFMAYLLAFSWVPGNDYVKSMLCYPLAFLCIPPLFALSKSNAFDRSFGELSYPVYLIHQIVLFLATYFITSGPMVIHWAIGLTLAVSWALHHFVQVPVDRVRQAWVDRDHARARAQA